MRTILTTIMLSMALISCNSHAQQNTLLSADDFEKGIEKNNIQVLDVRTPGEYADGHIENAFLADWTNQPQFKERVQSLDKTKPVYAYCLSGGRSGAAADWLKENGFTTVYNLEGGINSWKKAHKPLEGKSSVKQITLEEYNLGIQSNKIVLVDFSAVWCPPCKKMTPVIDSLDKTSNGAYAVLKYDGGAQTKLVQDLNVNGFPTFIVYKNGKETWRTEGITTYTSLLSKLK